MNSVVFDAVNSPVTFAVNSVVTFVENTDMGKFDVTTALTGESVRVVVVVVITLAPGEEIVAFCGENESAPVVAVINVASLIEQSTGARLSAPVVAVTIDIMD